MRVVALQQGHYNNRLIEPGQVFLINNDGDFAPQWMRPAKGETETPEPPRPHKTEAQLAKEEHERSIHYANLAAKNAAKDSKPKGETEALEEDGEGEELAPPPPSKRKKAASEEKPVPAAKPAKGKKSKAVL